MAFGIRFRSLKEFDDSEGTVTLVDSAHRLKSKNDIVLIPQPSDDVNDPLNWPAWKKTLAFSTIIVFTFLGTWVIGGIGSAIILLTMEFNRDLSDTVQAMVSWSVLALGAGNFFWVPTALYFGKRPAFLVASFLFFASIIWAAKASSFESLRAARIVAAFAAASTEGLAAAICADLFFLHERGWWMGVYIIFLNAGATLGSFLSGFIIRVGWRWHFWVCGIVAGVNAVSILLFFPEPQYGRKYITKAEPEKNATPYETSKEAAPEEETSNETADETRKYIESSIPKKSFLEELKPWSPLNPEASYLHLLLRPWPLIVYPAVFFAFIVFATTLAWVVCVVDTYASVFQYPPYNMSPSVSGLINIPAMIGIFAGAYCGGGLTDLIAERWARKHNGLFEPESRLIALIIPFVLVPLGLLMYGCGVQHLTNWAVPFIGYGFISFGLSAIPAITMTYVIDCYYPVAFEALLLVCGLKNIFAFGFSYGVINWIHLDTFQGAFGAMVGIQCGVMLFAVPFYYYGKQFRHASGTWRVISW